MEEAWLRMVVRDQENLATVTPGFSEDFARLAALQRQK